MTTQELVQKYHDYWEKENPEMARDLAELSTKVAFFNAKWGTSFTFGWAAQKEIPAPSTGGSN